jgi:protein-tyrosine phosphatase
MSYKILFVCLGNICRSPAGENVMNYLLQVRRLNSKISCDSAGTAGYHVGDPPDSRMITTLKKRGLPSQGAARQFSYQDFNDFDLILAMDFSNYKDILSLDYQEKYRNKVKLICEFSRNHSLKEVPDPYYGGNKGFEKVVDLLLDSCQGLLDHIENELNLSTIELE